MSLGLPAWFVRKRELEGPAPAPRRTHTVMLPPTMDDGVWEAFMRRAVLDERQAILDLLLAAPTVTVHGERYVEQYELVEQIRARR